MTTTTLTLAAFLEARLAEDEADLAAADKWSDEGTWWLPDFVTRTRLLADVAAKRGIVERLLQADGLVKANSEALGEALSGRRVEHGQVLALRAHGWELVGRRDAYLLVVDVLASVYADHPDYREEWR